MTGIDPAPGRAASPPTPSTDWEEHIEPGEEDLFKEFARHIRERQEKVARQEEIARQTGGRPLRGFHAKLHAGLMAEFRVMADLPPHARFGVFSEPRVFPAAVRFSNGTPTLQDDKLPEPRGLAIKLVGVPGRKLLTKPGEEDALTQDFLATSHSVTSTVRHVRQFIAFVLAEERGHLMLPFRLARGVGLREALRILMALRRTVLKSEVRSMATEHYSGTAPIKLGPYAVKFTVRPAEGTEPPPGNLPTAEPNFLREELADRLRKGDLLFDFVLQFYVDENRTPIEDTSVPWAPEVAPFVTVAQLRIPSCNLDDPPTAAQSKQIDGLSFTPWHATEDHRPLGNVMRARKFAYEVSSAHRRRSPEPTGIPL